LDALPTFVEQADPEIAANAMICAINQASYLLLRQLDSLGRQFMDNGGFTEQLYKRRASQRRTPKSD